MSEYAHSAHQAQDTQSMVELMRSIAPYIHSLREKTAVIAFPGELIESGHLTRFAQDVSLLNSLGIRLILVYGFQPQVEAQIKLKGLTIQNANGRQITDVAVLDCAQEAAGQLRIEIEAAFSQGLPNTPMADAEISLVSGNFLTAKPIGIIEGIDYQHTGVVRKVDILGLQRMLDINAMVLLSPFGFSPTGEAFNLLMEDVACSVATALKAEKLIFLSKAGGWFCEGELLSHLSRAEAEAILQNTPTNKQADELQTRYLRYAVKASRAGVERVHIIPMHTDGAVLMELFTHAGIGSMITSQELEHLREATIEDVGGILTLIDPLEQEGILVKRSRNEIETTIQNFTVIEHDGVIFACASLTAYHDQKTGELACLTVDHNSQNLGDGERILHHIEQRAKAQGLKSIFVLTTQAMHWFLKRGFRLGSIENLPKTRKQNYNYDRRSVVLVKAL